MFLPLQSRHRKPADSPLRVFRRRSQVLSKKSALRRQLLFRLKR
nr:MAG TPA: hypothetical protein [Caudoviricetes sp.]DAP89263.1 MAG TPA: hypothetical protein [Caudoviricetes sp.]DAQ58855.1 MAG TPA: hypothetical protein [Caudoviricetes sp.]DAT91915.1 MAG TPA: hypothetical protein [Caudoviricetes sp.]DAW15983.1 MAG TPA: hypothetical protein [Caudoviricetes sp.]